MFSHGCIILSTGVGVCLLVCLPRRGGVCLLVGLPGRGLPLEVGLSAGGLVRYRLTRHTPSPARHPPDMPRNSQSNTFLPTVHCVADMCHSVHRVCLLGGGGSASRGGWSDSPLPRPDTHPTWPDPPGQTPPPPPYMLSNSQLAIGTHPDGMHSCSFKFLRLCILGKLSNCLRCLENVLTKIKWEP